MPTYDEVLFLGIEYGALALTPMLLILLTFFIERWRKRRWVFLDVQTIAGPSFRKQYPPKKGVVMTKKSGTFAVPSEGQSGTFKGKPLFRVKEGYPYPIVYTHDRVPIWETKKIKKPDGTEAMENVVSGYQEIVKPMPIAPSSFRISAYERDRTHSQVYSGNPRAEMLLIAIAVLVVIVLIATVAK